MKTRLDWSMESNVIGPINLEDWMLMRTLNTSIPWLKKQDQNRFGKTLGMEQKIFYEYKKKYLTNI